MRSMTKAAVLALLMSTAPAHALMPESGIFVIEGLGGVGLDLEIQDNLLGMGIYTYDPVTGDPLFYTSANFMEGDSHYEGTLDYNFGGSSLGGPFFQHTVIIGDGGNVTIDFEDAHSGTISFENIALAGLPEAKGTPAVYNFQRAFFGFGPSMIERLMGEWSITTDFGVFNPAFPFSGDVLIFDVFESTPEGDFIDGCRPASILAGECTDADVIAHGAVAAYDEVNEEFVVLLDDSTNFWMEFFFPVVGARRADGVVEFYPKPDLHNNIFSPLRGLRTASRAFVTTGSGPAGDGDPSTLTRASSKSLGNDSRALSIPSEPRVIEDPVEQQKVDRRRAFTARLKQRLEQNKQERLNLSDE
ncbi:MAG: hypothetical protein DHS20C11_09920 [Lysobacteraceae bacterium]|nr:MAG: hypothetical protein DHS20C11_09920 [Xanthomonadaceae bacterium]